MLKINKNKMVFIVFALLIAVILIGGCTKTTAPQKGHSAPNITEKTLDGRDVKLSDY